MKVLFFSLIAMLCACQHPYTKISDDSKGNVPPRYVESKLATKVLNHWEKEEEAMKEKAIIVADEKDRKRLQKIREYIIKMKNHR